MKKNNQQSYRQIRLAGIVLVTCILAIAMMGSLKLRDTHPPVIQVWYGERQEFGSLGLPQKWVNVLGNVSDADGAVTRLSYRLNGGEVVSLKQGPDLRRLLKTGDFNAEFDVADLNEGSNQLVLEAADESGLMATAHVELILHKNRRWPLPYSIDWSTILNASDVLQITDGMWT